jgi:hypothetical protein
VRAEGDSGDRSGVRQKGVNEFDRITDGIFGAANPM